MICLLEQFFIRHIDGKYRSALRRLFQDSLFNLQLVSWDLFCKWSIFSVPITETPIDHALFFGLGQIIFAAF